MDDKEMMPISDTLDMPDIPFIAYEYNMARFERTIKRLIIALVIAIVLLAGSNIFWLYEWSCYDTATVTVDGQDGGNANFMGAGSSGVINNGQSNSENAD